MKKILISVLLVSLAFAAFADDAKVLPSGVLRATFANILINTDSEFDADGKKQDSGSEMMFDNFGAALEFGVTDTISAALQWAPGTMLYSSMENDGLDTTLAGYGLTVSSEDAVFSGLADLFIGAKVQVVNDGTMRFAFAPGLAVPLDSYDAREEGKNMLSGDEFRLADQSETDNLGLGLRIYFDYQITEDFYINFYNQTRYYFSNEKYGENAAITYAATYNGAYAAAIGGGADAATAAALATSSAEAATPKVEYEYPVYLDFELEPHYDLTLSKTGSMGFGLPIDFSVNGKTKVEGSDVEDSDEYILAINPGVSFFYTGGIPFEVAANYSIPLMGKNIDMVRSVFTFKLKLFYDFY